MVRFCLQGFIKLCEKIFNVYKKAEPGVIQVCLQNTVYTIHGTVHPDIKHLISTTIILPGTGTGLEKPSPVSTEKKRLLASSQIFRVNPVNFRSPVIFDKRYGQTAAFDYFPGIRIIIALLFNIKSGHKL